MKRITNKQKFWFKKRVLTEQQRKQTLLDRKKDAKATISGYIDIAMPARFGIYKQSERKNSLKCCKRFE